MINIAGKLFATRSFDAVSTREIAIAASVNLSAISYHFGNKEGLYRAVFKKIVRDLKPARVNLGLFLQNGMSEAGDDRRELAEMMVRIISDLLDNALAPENLSWRMRLIAREMTAPTECFQILLNGHLKIMHDLSGMLIAKIMGEPASSETVRLTAQALLHLCSQYAINEQLVKSRLEWENFGPEEIGKIKKALIPLILRALNLGEHVDIVLVPKWR